MLICKRYPTSVGHSLSCPSTLISRRDSVDNTVLLRYNVPWSSTPPPPVFYHVLVAFHPLYRSSLGFFLERGPQIIKFDLKALSWNIHHVTLQSLLCS